MMSYEKALQKIKDDEKCKPNFCCCSIICPTGPTREINHMLHF